jgi:hypothetical protein
LPVRQRVFFAGDKVSLGCSVAVVGAQGVAGENRSMVLARAREARGATNEDRNGGCPMMVAWFDKVKTFIGWDLADRARMATVRRCLDSDLTEVIEALGKQLSRLKGTQPLMANARFVQRLHGILLEWLMGLLDGAFDGEYVQERWTFGRKLVEIDLTFEEFILLEGLARVHLFELAQRKLGEHPKELSSTMCTLDKALNLDMALIYSAYLEVRSAEMERALLDRFLAVTGFSRTLYENLAEAREWTGGGRLQTKLS